MRAEQWQAGDGEIERAMGDALARSGALPWLRREGFRGVGLSRDFRLDPRVPPRSRRSDVGGVCVHPAGAGAYALVNADYVRRHGVATAALGRRAAGVASRALGPAGAAAAIAVHEATHGVVRALLRREAAGDAGAAAALGAAREAHAWAWIDDRFVSRRATDGLMEFIAETHAAAVLYGAEGVGLHPASAGMIARLRAYLRGERAGRAAPEAHPADVAAPDAHLADEAVDEGRAVREAGRPVAVHVADRDHRPAVGRREAA